MMNKQMIETYKMKVTTVEAVQLAEIYGESDRDLIKRAVNIALWCGGSVEKEDGKITIVIPTPSGTITARAGDYIVFDGSDFSVMSADTFHSKYSKVNMRELFTR